MGWETRKGRGKYYTRSERVDGKVVRTYVGQPVAALVAALEQLSRETAQRERRWAAAQWEQEQESAEELDGIVADFCDEAEAAYRAALEAGGYHQHARGEWRRRRREEHDND